MKLITEKAVLRRNHPPDGSFSLPETPKLPALCWSITKSNILRFLIQLCIINCLALDEIESKSSPLSASSFLRNSLVFITQSSGATWQPALKLKENENYSIQQQREKNPQWRPYKPIGDIKTNPKNLFRGEKLYKILEQFLLHTKYIIKHEREAKNTKFHGKSNEQKLIFYFFIQFWWSAGGGTGIE